jgi:DNA-binding SARP family transcriptional activator
MATDRPGPAGSSPAPVTLSVLGGFEFWQGSRAVMTLAAGPRRLLAFFALHQHAARGIVATTLWPDASESRAGASLRSTLSRLDPAARRALVVGVTDLCLADGVTVDLSRSRALAHRLLDPRVPAHPADVSAEAVTALSTELLPGWYDDWVIVEAGDWRQLRLHALEALADRLADAGQYGEATSAASAAITAEPLRESAHAALIRVHLAEGNQSEALAEYERYRALLNRELGLEPTVHLRQVLDHLLRR